MARTVPWLRSGTSHTTRSTALLGVVFFSSTSEKFSTVDELQDSLADSLTAATGLSRFQQRLLDHDSLDSLNSLDSHASSTSSAQLVALQFCPVDVEQTEEMMSACQTNDVQKLEWLLKQPQDPNQLDVFGKTPLHCAVKNGAKACVKLLVSAGADLNCQDADGATPLHVAVLQGHTEVAGLLLQLGAKPDVATQKGVTPLQVAVAQGHRNILRLLRPLELRTDPGS